MRNTENGYEDAQPIKKIEISNISRRSAEEGASSQNQSFGQIFDNPMMNNGHGGGNIYEH